MAIAFLSLGSSLGERETTLDSAINELKNYGEVLAISSLHYSKPEGRVAKNEFVNACVKLQTLLSPQKLLQACQFIEAQHGRTRTQKWEDRTLDIDIITYDDLVIDEPNLKTPHPLAATREFVLNPMKEIQS
jgi:2-amino-4-hydroxy-6-hydroxymethyldihydropteridine diphosphokinase